MESPGAAKLYRDLGELSLEELGALGEALKREKRSRVDRLSSLAPELLLPIFQLVQDSASEHSRPPVALSAPLSRSLASTQQLVLYQKLIINDRKTLFKLERSLNASRLGHLVETIECLIEEDEQKELAYFSSGYDAFLESMESEVQPRKEDSFYEAVESLIHLTPKIKNIDVPWNPTLGSFYLAHINHFSCLRTLHLRIDDTKDLRNLLTLPLVTDISLGVVGGWDRPSRDGNISQVRGGSRQLKLVKLELLGHIYQPLINDWLRCIDAVNVRIQNDFGPLVDLSLISTVTTNLALISDSKVVRIVDPQINQFQLQHLTIGGNGIQISDQFFSTLLHPTASSLLTLTIVPKFNLNAKALIAAISPTTSARQLKRIQLDFLHFYKDDEANYASGLWTSKCSLKDIARLIKVARDKGVLLEGQTIDAYTCCSKARKP